MRGIQQHGSAGVDGEAEEGHSRLTSGLARHQGERLWCCWHNLPLEEETKGHGSDISVGKFESFKIVIIISYRHSYTTTSLFINDDSNMYCILVNKMASTDTDLGFLGL